MVLLDSLTLVEIEQLLGVSVYVLTLAFGSGIFCRFMLSWTSPGRY